MKTGVVAGSGTTATQTVAYAYQHLFTADDERIWTFQSGAPSRWTLRDLDGSVLREFKNNAGTWTVEHDYVHRDGTLLAAVTPTETTHFHPDHLGTPRLITGTGGAYKSYHAYHPYGTEATAFNQDAMGSGLARSDLRSAINSSDTVYGISRNQSPTVNMGRRAGPHLYMDFHDIGMINAGKNSLETFDASMIFLHELKHWQGLSDPTKAMLRRIPGAKGDTVNHMNRIRKELGLELRSQYKTESDRSGQEYIPFGKGPVFVPSP